MLFSVKMVIKVSRVVLCGMWVVVVVSNGVLMNMFSV